MRTQQPIRSFVLAGLLLALAAPGALAEDWQFRALGQWNSLSDEVLSEVDEGLGVYLGVERRLSDRWGVEVGLGWNQVDGSVSETIDIFGITFESRIDSEVEWLPVSAAGNFYLTPRSDFDLYVSGRVGWAFFRDVQVTTDVDISGLPFPGPVIDPDPQTVDFTTDDVFFYGVRVGFDRPFGDGGWSVSATADWTVLELEYDPRSAFAPPFADPIPTVSADLDPVTVGVGVSKRW